MNDQTLQAGIIAVLLWRTGIAIAAAGVGALIAISFKKITHKTLCALVSSAAGALLAVTLVHIIPETAELVEWPLTILTVGIGIGAFYIIGKYVYAVCPACAASATEKEHGYISLGVLLMITLGIHSTMDGLAIAAGAKLAGPSHVSMLGILILFAVSYHKVPEGVALASVAMLAGYSRWKALTAAVLIELTTALGAFMEIFIFRAVTETALGVILGLVGGSFIYVVGFAMLGEMWVHEKKSILIYATLGFASIQIIQLILDALHLVH